MDEYLDIGSLACPVPCLNKGKVVIIIIQCVPRVKVETM